ncbi:hypothetical protein O6H91_05G050600 [Diphasiastrum complanatum]|uniref:Uncharacterized protein n=1 Tax=Diphasiastrum complanatum TaxID=34168 RepID=A0ACC2DNC5_DIPCM|nr:hypothetical protein O6H91_05G050600 [Diphasiastrum complanatum]
MAASSVMRLAMVAISSFLLASLIFTLLPISSSSSSSPVLPSRLELHPPSLPNAKANAGTILGGNGDLQNARATDEDGGGERVSIYHSVGIIERNYREMERDFKVYVYPDGDPNTYFQTPRKITGKYSSEGYFFQNLRESQFLTDDPQKAHLFFLPISCHKMRGKGISYDRMAVIIQEYVESLMSKYPFWNRTLGADHFFVTCHDVGARATTRVPNLVKNAIRVVCSPSYGGEYIPHKDVALPQILQPFALPRGGNDIENRSQKLKNQS